MSQDGVRFSIKCLRELHERMTLSLSEKTDEKDQISIAYSEGLLQGVDRAIEELVGELF